MQQLTLYHRINFLRRFDSFFPLFVAIAAHYHINIAQVFLLESTFALSMMLSEIPTGYYSDRYNRTDCLLFGCWMFCFSCILYLTWANFWCWALANMFSGIAYACFSGSDTALLYEWLHEDQSQSYMAHESRMQAWSRYAEGVSAFLGAAMLYLHPLLPVFAFLVSKLAMTAHMYSFLRANDKTTTSSATTARSTQSRKTFISQCKLFIAQVRPDGGLSLLVCSSILNCIMFVFFWILQAQLVILEISLFATGLYWLIFFGCAGFVSMCCGNIDRHIRSEWMLMQLVIALYACVLFLIACTWLKPHAALWWLSGFALIVGT